MQSVLITGANTGIGLQTAIALAQQGYHLIVAVRSEEKALGTIAHIEEKCPEAKNHIDFIILDLMDLHSVSDAANNILNTQKKLHILICNAGCNAAGTNEARLDPLWCANYLGHYHLTRLLYPLLKSTAREEKRPTRVIQVSSIMHRMAFGEFEKASTRRILNSYSETKLAQLMFSYEFHRRYGSVDDSTGRVVSICLTPGSVHSDIWRHVKGVPGKLLSIFFRLTLLDTQHGAVTTIKAATVEPPSPSKLLYYSPYFVTNLHNDIANLLIEVWAPQCTVRTRDCYSSKLSYDTSLARHLWDISEDMVKTVVKDAPYLRQQQSLALLS